MKKSLRIITLSLIAGTLLGGCTNTMNAIDVDFSKKDGTTVQNIKKIDSFAPTWAWVTGDKGVIDNNSLNCVPVAQEIKNESLRFDLFMGYTGLGYSIGRDGKDGSSDEEYKYIMQLLNKLKDNRVLPLICYFASPEYSSSGNWKNPPKEDKWETLCYNIANYLKNKGIRLSSHEIWNEPDFNGSFFSGDWDEYLNTYIAGYKGIKAANPDAQVSAMSVAWPANAFGKKYYLNDKYGTDWKRLVDSCYEKYMPDQVSWHYYGREGQIRNRDDDTENFSYYLNAARNAIRGFQFGTSDECGGVKYDKLDTLQMLVNEFNIYQPSSDDIYQTTRMIPGMFDAIDVILQATDVTKVSWSALIGEKKDGLNYGLIDGLSFQRYPALHTLWMYGHLPVDRVSVDLGNKNLGTFAGVDSGRAGLIVWNKSQEKQSVNVRLTGVPFEKGDLDVYLLDDNHMSYTTKNAPIKVRERKNTTINGEYVKMELSPNSVYYIEANSLETKTDLDQYKNIGSIVKRNYWYPERADNLPYSEVQESSLTAHVGMANNETGKSAVCLTMDDMDVNPKITLNYENWGNVSNSANASMGVRIDYQDASGEYVKSVLYNALNMTGNIAIPFGTKKAADKVINLLYEKGKLDINLLDQAPADWTGRVDITYLVSDAGKTATSKYIITQ